MEAVTKTLFNVIITHWSKHATTLRNINLRQEAYSDLLFPDQRTIFHRLIKSYPTASEDVRILTELMSVKFQNEGSPNIMIILKRLSNWNDPELRMALAYKGIIGSSFSFTILIIGQIRESTPQIIFKKLSSMGVKVCFYSDFNLCTAYDFIATLPSYRNVFCLSDISSKITPASILILSGIFGKVILNMSTILTTGSPHLQVINSFSKYSMDSSAEYSEIPYGFPNGGAFFLSRPFFNNLSSDLASKPPALIAFTSLHKFNHEFSRLLVAIIQNLAIPVHLYPYAPHFSSQDSAIIDELRSNSKIKVFASSEFYSNSCEFNYLFGLSSPAYPNVTSLVDLMYQGIPTVSWVSSFKRKNMGCLFNQILDLDHFNFTYDKSSLDVVEKFDALLGLMAEKQDIQRTFLSSAIVV